MGLRREKLGPSVKFMHRGEVVRQGEKAALAGALYRSKLRAASWSKFQGQTVWAMTTHHTTHHPGWTSATCSILAAEAKLPAAPVAHLLLILWSVTMLQNDQ
jgi:hypothetical protein